VQKKKKKIVCEMWLWRCFCDIHAAALYHCSSLYFDEDGDLAHEFYEETVVTKNGRKKAKLKRIQKNLIPQVSYTDPVRYMDMFSAKMTGSTQEIKCNLYRIIINDGD